jgi:DNA-binding transcriptional MocR family regulator
MSLDISRWNLRIRSSAAPAYRAIADVIGEDIDSGRLVAHQRLPPVRELAQRLERNFTTVARGYAEAARRGLIVSRPGTGTRVAERIRAGAVRRAGPAGLPDMMMNMAPEPEDSALAARLWQGFAGIAGRRESATLWSLLRYDEAGGPPEDRASGAQWLSRHLPAVSAERVLVFPGVQAALLALLVTLTRPGDRVACEAITYSGLKGLAAQLGVALIGLRSDRHGLDPDAFAALCAADPPAALYCNPTLQNPTTATLPAERRRAIAEVACRYNVPIIEDDPYRPLTPEAPPPLAALAPELCFHATGLAKCLGAGLRVAYVAAPHARYQARLAAAMRATMVMPAPFMVRLATQWLQDGTVDVATEAIRRESAQRQRLASDILAGTGYWAAANGFHLWLPLPAHSSAARFASDLRARGCAVVAADAFSIREAPTPAARICLGGPVSRSGCRDMLQAVAAELVAAADGVAARAAG